MGDKIIAKETMQKLGVPCVPGSDGPLRDGAHAAATGPRDRLAGADQGRRRRRPRHAARHGRGRDRLRPGPPRGHGLWRRPRVYGKTLSRPRHIEIQILADGHGNVVHLGERDCSPSGAIKVLEEAPSPGLNAQARADIGQRAVAAVRDMGYRGVGTRSSSTRTIGSISSK